MKRAILVDYIRGALCPGYSRVSILGSVLFVICSFFYLYTIASELKLEVYPFQGRFTIYTIFNFYIINQTTDHIIIGLLFLSWILLSFRRSIISYVSLIVLGTIFVLGLALYAPILTAMAVSAVPAMISLIFYSKRRPDSIFQNISTPIPFYLSLAAIGIGIIGLFLVIATLITSSPFLTHNNTLTIRNYVYDLFLIFSKFSPILVLLLASCYPLSMLVKNVNLIWRKKIINQNKTTIQLKPTFQLILLIFSLALSVIIAIIPHLNSINPDTKQVGVDTGYYVNWINNLNKSNNVPEFFHQAFVVQNNGDRPLSLILLFLLEQLVKTELFVTIEWLPILLGPAIVLSVFLLVQELTLNRNIALFASFLTSMSFQILIGIYAGFYANWIALIFGYSALAFLIRYARNGCNKDLIVFLFLFVLTLFSHVYTWSILAIFSGIFLISMLKLDYFKNRKRIAFLLIALILTVLVDFGRTSLIGVSSGVESDLAIAQKFAGIEQFVSRWQNLNYTINTFVGGQFSNFIMFGLAIYWLKLRTGGIADLFIMIFLSISILPILFGDWTVQTRVLYDIPFQIPAAIALGQITKDRDWRTIILPMCIWLIVISIRAVSNYYLVSPI